MTVYDHTRENGIFDTHTPVTPMTKYLASLYFAVVTFSTVGYGDMTPTVTETPRH